MKFKLCQDGIKVCVVCEEPRKCTEYFSAGTIKGKKHFRRVCKFCYNKTKKAYKSKNKKWLKDLKDTLECGRCGYSKKSHKSFTSKALQFHHTNKDKEFSVSDGTNWGLSIKKIQKEINKCEVLCARCHAETHYN